HMEASLSGIRVDLASLESLVVGGIGLATPGGDGPAASDGDKFSLFRNRRQAFREYHESRGLHIFLDAPERGSVKVDDDVLYRGEKVGRVLRHRLKEDSRLIGIEIQIFPRFAPLVRKGSKFWNSSGLSADLGLTGVHVHVSSLESLFEGSVSFSTPDPPGELAEKGMTFTLSSKPKDKWLKWQPAIQLKSDPDGDETARLRRDDM
ncbi:MAG: MlaD family protein, partial [Myxococcota bacterium]